ncbi:DUF4268 domain-containing protein [Maribacter sp. 2308TA10-17]|uniref:DUF4268 domain-containing protein n=1 Tax=Maribacter sp. 2308TA10-17 TaxID=3386276 RepID=UPI0039BD8D9B
MFSTEESKQLRGDFWMAFGKSYPHKWILYDTKIKGLSLKFHFDLKMATVSLDIETIDLEQRIKLWEKLYALKSILINEYLSEVRFEDSFTLENQKEISRIYVRKEGVSIHNKNTWRETMEFLNRNMILLERFFQEYKEIIYS